MIITIPLRTVSEANSRTHWAAKAKRVRQQRTTVGLVVAAEMAIRGRVKAPCSVLLVRLGPTSGLDDDNLVGALKAPRDGVADALGINDRNPRVTWRYEQRRAKVWGIEIRIEAASEVAA